MRFERLRRALAPAGRPPARVCWVGPEGLGIEHRPGGVARGRVELAPDAEGLALFERYLALTPGLPVWLVIDSAEEQYRWESLPALGRAERATLLARRCAKAFPGAFASHAEGGPPARDGEQRCLLLGLPAPAELGHWMPALQRTRAPVAGLQSFALLGQGLVRGLACAGPQSLLASLQGGHSLRQSLFIEGALAASRLVRLPAEPPVARAGRVLEELARLRRHLLGLGLAGAAEAEALFLGGGPLAAALQAVSAGQGPLRVLAPAEAAAALGLPAAVVCTDSDALYSALFWRGGWCDHYGGSLARAAAGRPARASLLAAGGLAAVAAGALGSLGLTADALGRAGQLAPLGQALAEERARLEAARAAAPESALDAAAVLAAVELGRRLDARRASPREALHTLSRALDAHPSVRLESLDWAVGEETPGEGASAVGCDVAGQPSPGTTGPRAWLRLALRLAPAVPGLAEAERRVDDFRRSLAALPGVLAVELDTGPLDAQSQGTVEAGAATPDADAGAVWRLRVCVGQDPEGEGEQPASGGGREGV